MDVFDFEELVAEILNITDEQRENDDFLPVKFYEKFNIEFDIAYEFTKHIILHTEPVKAGLSGKYYHAFVSREAPVMFMKIEAEGGMDGQGIKERVNLRHLQ